MNIGARIKILKVNREKKYCASKECEGKMATVVSITISGIYVIVDKLGIGCMLYNLDPNVEWEEVKRK